MRRATLLAVLLILVVVVTSCVQAAPAPAASPAAPAAQTGGTQPIAKWCSGVKITFFPAGRAAGEEGNLDTRAPLGDRLGAARLCGGGSRRRGRSRGSLNARSDDDHENQKNCKQRCPTHVLLLDDVRL